MSDACITPISRRGCRSLANGNRNPLSRCRIVNDVLAGPYLAQCLHTSFCVVEGLHCLTVASQLKMQKGRRNWRKRSHAPSGPPHRPNPTAGCVRWGKQSGYVVFAGQEIPLERPRLRTRVAAIN